VSCGPSFKSTPTANIKYSPTSSEGKKFNSPNDIVVGPDGALFFTDPTLDLPKGETQEIPYQGVYRLKVPQCLKGRICACVAISILGRQLDCESPTR
jgi:sugar lactone lactonase YvrE